MSRIDHAQRADEAISLSDYGLEETWFVGAVAKSRANLPHDVVDVLFAVNEQIGAPEFLDDFFARHHLLAASGEQDEQLHRLFRQLDAAAGPAQFVTAQVELDLAGPLFPHAHSNR